MASPTTATPSKLVGGSTRTWATPGPPSWDGRGSSTSVSAVHVDESGAVDPLEGGGLGARLGARDVSVRTLRRAAA